MQYKRCRYFGWWCWLRKNKATGSPRCCASSSASTTWASSRLMPCPSCARGIHWLNVSLRMTVAGSWCSST
ncbi:hypothetical protein V5799_024275 [Amblyomma americanum]|uniref:Uncharacterized protein n=1 Tax=Amblyomma americanum TaxID=6943 RepID=A0AAQ4ECY2_AMBAM